MKQRTRLTRREAALIAAALLLPIPLFAQSGLSVPLPDSVSRRLGSLVTVEVSDERSGTTATGNVSENGSNARRSGRGTLRIKRGSRRSLLPDRLPRVTDVIGGAPDQPAGASGSGGGNTPAGGEPGGDGGNAGSPGNPGSGSGSSGSGASGPDGGSAATDPGIRVGVSGQGPGAGVAAGTDDSDVDVGADSGGAPSDETGSVTVEITGTDGSTTGAGVTVPGVGAPTLPTVP
jgi:hypothetical protein